MYIQLPIKCEGNFETYKDAGNLPPMAQHVKKLVKEFF